MYPVELTGARVRVRDYTADDADAVWKVVQEQPGSIFAPGTASDLDGVRRWLEGQVVIARDRARALHRLAIELTETGELIGGARIDIEAAMHGLGSIGYGLRPDQQGKGLATEAADLVVGFGFEELGLHRIEALVQPWNTASQRVVAKLGMTEEGRLRERFLEADGWHDALVFSILEHEWRARR